MIRRNYRRPVIVCIIIIIVNLCVYLICREQHSTHRGSIPTRNSVGVIGGTLTKTMPAMDYEFVIAHHQEKLDWLRPVAKFCHVYDKGHDSGLKPQFGVRHWEELPNVGRESHTYLHHIIENYDSLANTTVFLRGNISSRAPTSCFQTPNEFLEKARTGVLCVWNGKYSEWGKMQHNSGWKKDWDLGHMRHANMTVGQFYQMAFGKAPPTSVDICLAGCFSATRRCLRRHPKEFYQKLISHLADHSNPEEGYYLERLWFTIVSC